MKMKTIKNYIIFGILFWTGIFPALAKQELLDRVVAVVNDDVITQSEVDGLLRPLYEQYMRDYSGETMTKMLAEAQGKILSQLIEDRLAYHEALNKKIEVSERDIEREAVRAAESGNSRDGLARIHARLLSRAVTC